MHGIDCPACSTSTPSYTQTFAGVTHRSRACAEVARRANVNAGNVHALTERLRTTTEAMEGRATWCERCGVLMMDADGPLCIEDGEFWGGGA
jgi:hypothetical protein